MWLKSKDGFIINTDYLMSVVIKESTKNEGKHCLCMRLHGTDLFYEYSYHKSRYAAETALKKIYKEITGGGD